MRRSALLFSALALLTPAFAQPEPLGAVVIAGVDVTGLLPDEARERLREELVAKLDQPLTLTDGEVTVTRTRAQLGIGLNVDGMVQRAKEGDAWVPLLLEVDEDAFGAALGDLAPRFSFPGQDAKPYTWRGQFRMRPALSRREVNVAQSVARLAPQIEQNAATVRLSLTLDKRPPRVTNELLRGIDGRLSTFSTRFNPAQENRTHNVRLGVRAIDGTILRPNEVFSLNDTVGERTPERGYRQATIFMDGRLVDGYGGGISQVTGTLFNAALEAGLRIVTYRCHSRPVAYLPLGRDATVAWGQFDMRFRNSTSAAIYITYEMHANTIAATLYGRRTPGQRVEIDVETERKAERHIIARLYRTIHRRGQAPERRSLGSTEYQWEADHPEE